MPAVNPFGFHPLLRLFPFTEGVWRKQAAYIIMVVQPDRMQVRGEERMTGNRKLDKWAEQLLDTGRRNNLISFRDTKSSSAEVLVPRSDVLFAKAEGNTAFEVFDPKIQDDEADAGSGEILSREAFYDRYAGKIRKQSQLLVYSSGGNPITALRTIERRAKEFLEETGVNVAYLAFGFIHWKESTASEQENLAPILLVPITLSRASAIDPYVIRTEDSEITVNPTFAYKLNAEYGIHLPEYNDEGLTEYLSAISDIVSRLNWSVTDECRIGIFSFLKINMYQDLKENADLILQNDNMRALLGEPAKIEEESEISAREERTENPLVDLHSVIDADSSQIEAIELAKSGVSFVLQGPPGTGKSQTITNIIAECLSDGKKVLFVSEKQAALNVVFDKLKQAGLEEFCLELHSYQSNRRAVIDNLCRTLKADSSNVSSRVEAEIEQKKQAQAQLDSYAMELHRKRQGINKSVYQLFEKYASMRNAPDVNWHFENIETKGEAYLRDTVPLIRQFAEFIPSVGYEYRNNPWYGYTVPDVSYQTKLKTEGSLARVSEILKQLLPPSRTLSEEFCLPELSVNGLKKWNKLLKVLKHTDFLKPELLREREADQRFSMIEKMGGIAEEIQKIREQISREYDSSVYDLDSRDAGNRLTRLYGSFVSRIFNPDYHRISDQYRLCRKDGRKPFYEELVSVTGRLNHLKDLEKEFQGYENSLKGVLGDAYAGIDTDWDALMNQLRTIRDALALQGSLGGFADMPYEEFRRKQKDMEQTEKILSHLLQEGEAALSDLAASFDPSVIDFLNCSVSAALKRIDDCLKETDRLENWIQFRALLAGLREKEALSFIDEAIRENIPKEQFVPAFEKRFFDQWISSILFRVPVLARFSRVSQDDAIAVFAEKDIEQFEINKAVIRSRLSHNRPSLDMVAGGSAAAILLHEGGKKRKQMSIRRLLSETGDLVQRIKPCFLMSPLSVSTFLDPRVIHFDVVIFDEASQIFPQDAVGAIYRADQAIIVGDSRQMPPSSFFSSVVEVMNEDEEDDVTDFESILDLCSTTMKTLRLRWHYRSRYEQLIAFSNRNFYDGDLVTFPSSVPDHKGIGIDYFHVDGLFDRRTHTNRKEAEYIVDLIYENMNRYPDRSLGVVAFSVAQQNLIETLLNRRRALRPESEYYFSHDRKEPFFIKNLETVQGDERDTILFSVAYGKDIQNRLLLNFGPLSKAGGERRLNVAVTRARCNVQIVSSMHHQDIDLGRAKSEGARLLKEYLDYAENGEIALERSLKISGYDQYDSDFEMEVCEFLRSKGYTVDTQVGCSGYRIDMGLRSADTSEYFLAVECDGAAYHSSRNARDRDRLRQEVLERMGWKFYRIWSTDWFRNKAVEKDRLLLAAEMALFAVSRTAIRKSGRPVDMSDFEDSVERKVSFPKYQAADIDRLMEKADGDYLELVREILEIESPVSEEYLMKRTCRFFDREKVTKLVKGGFEYHMRDCEQYGMIRRNGFLYLKGKTKVTFRVPGDLTRDVKYICPEELASGILSILAQNVSADKDGLYRKMAELCGVRRMGTNITNAFDGAVNYLRDHGMIVIDGDQITLRQ